MYPSSVYSLLLLPTAKMYFQGLPLRGPIYVQYTRVPLLSLSLHVCKQSRQGSALALGPHTTATVST